MIVTGIVVTKASDESNNVQKEQLDIGELENGEILIETRFSSLNFKDTLALKKKSAVIRKYPMIPGIDLAGVVVATKSKIFQEGDMVFATGYGIGEKYFGGFADKSIIKEEFAIKVPSGLDLKSTMSIGTAGFTAMLAVDILENSNVRNLKGEILVTGSTGGVGLFSIYLLSKLGFSVVASSSKKNEFDFLKKIGASRTIDSSELAVDPKLLEGQKWIGAVDSLGGKTLANICASTYYGGVITACGNAESFSLQTSVAPLILRGISIIGVDSVYAPMHHRKKIWNKLATLVEPSFLNKIVHEITIDQVLEYAKNIQENKNVGRSVVKIN